MAQPFDCRDCIVDVCDRCFDSDAVDDVRHSESNWGSIFMIVFQQCVCKDSIVKKAKADAEAEDACNLAWIL